MEEIVRIKLDNYFQSNPLEWDNIINILTYRDVVNLYWVEQFIKISKKENYHFIDKNRNHIFIYHQFIAERKSYSKKLFNFHQRPPFWQLNQLKNKDIEIFCYNGKTLKTTLAILHFLYWFKKTGVYEFALKNYDTINTKISNSNNAICFT